MSHSITRGVALCAALAIPLLLAPGAATADAGNPCNPCAKKQANPCNPCAKKKPNPCAGSRIDAERFKQPKGSTLASGSHSELVSRGQELWNDKGLGKSGLACADCHTDRYGLMNDTFDEPYPHYVEMPAQRAGVSEVNAAEMVNFCMLVPMADEPLPWTSRELAALSAYVEKLQTGFSSGSSAAANRRNPCNPCSR